MHSEFLGMTTSYAYTVLIYYLLLTMSSCSSSLSLGPVANATDVLQP